MRVEFSIKIDTVKSGLSIVYIEGSQVIICKKIQSGSALFAKDKINLHMQRKKCNISFSED